MLSDCSRYFRDTHSPVLLLLHHGLDYKRPGRFQPIGSSPLAGCKISHFAHSADKMPLCSSADRGHLTSMNRPLNSLLLVTKERANDTNRTTITSSSSCPTQTLSPSLDVGLVTPGLPYTEERAWDGHSSIGFDAASWWYLR